MHSNWEKSQNKVHSKKSELSHKHRFLSVLSIDIFLPQRYVNRKWLSCSQLGNISIGWKQKRKLLDCWRKLHEKKSELTPVWSDTGTPAAPWGWHTSWCWSRTTVASSCYNIQFIQNGQRKNAYRRSACQECFHETQRPSFNMRVWKRACRHQEISLQHIWWNCIIQSPPLNMLDWEGEFVKESWRLGLRDSKIPPDMLLHPSHDFIPH